jgi:hypothetical protein
MNKHKSLICRRNTTEGLKLYLINDLGKFDGIAEFWKESHKTADKQLATHLRQKSVTVMERQYHSRGMIRVI